ncbi:metastasis-associated protein MTA1 isoform X4 [Canis lupus familiaris]|uniref:metastasis-associated protein MTA1 isoform X3 n=1 Tax=Canis lupus dingo TaxID=286419 RepID=UPI0015F12955|nr:metastasis-associated protein MTA1 isoform X3 [Canis lupus dingo]XP_038401884.1 metastasis-associated protein MTA1 isoform X4 [Canis lupus familiaris]XP_038453230.1 metastasis-associated protein MTA1 isoform X4 [Canis lupus familiaris]XP_038530791.1 metastasis-associated protein MTA1 isoform X4 [Canis lupus familiaris]
MLAGASPHGGAVGPLERTELAWVLGQDLCSEWPFGCVPADTGLLQAFPGARGTARGTPAGDCSLASSWHRVTRSCPELPAISRRRPGWQLGGLPAGLGSVGAGQPPPWASWEIPGACQPPGDRSQAALEPEASWCPHDYVYFENSSSNPYLIRRIEELNKTANGNVEAKVVCFYRRRDISSTLIALADKHATLSVCYKTGPGADNGEEGEIEEEMENPEMVDLPEKLKHQLRHRELFLSRQLESLPATHIRGKCSVTLLNETESLKSYLEREDFFFYSLVYDPQQKTLLADKGEIRVGNRYQADITDLLKEGEEDGRDQSRLETKVWEAHNPLIDKQIDQFLVVARSVGTFARALDCSSSVRQPSLHMSAAAASRDITLFHAMDTLHKSVYDVAKAISALVPQGGPVLCRDEMEEWSASEASLFEEALEKYGKDFTDIQQDFLPWKSLTSIIEYYYMWKTTDRYVQQKRLKAAEAESKLKQVYIPNYNKPNPNQISVNNVKAGVVNGAGAPGQSPGAGRACESCYTAQSYQWYSWGPPNMQCRLCASCWTYWKKYGGLKMPTRLDGERPGPNRSNMSPHGIPARSSGSPKFAMKTRQAFYLHTTKLTRIARRLCREILRPWHAARHPYMPINSAAIKAECTARLPEASQSPLVLKQAVRKPLEAVLRYLGLANHGQTRHMGPSRNLLLNGKSYPTKVRLIRGGSLPPVKRRRMNWIDAPDDVFYMATEETRKIRKLLSSSETKRAARRPYKPIALRQSQALPLRPPPPAPVNDEPIVIED